jgi:hypothetical protein
VSTTKTPAPLRAGTANATEGRAAREAAALKQLDELREISPEIYTEMLNLLAAMVVKQEGSQEICTRDTRTKF